MSDQYFESLKAAEWHAQGVQNSKFDQTDNESSTEDFDELLQRAARVM